MTWREIEAGVRLDFRIDDVRQRVARVVDLWRPLPQKRGRVDLREFNL